MSFQEWLKKNNTHLRSYAPDEVARLALSVGFPLEVVCPGICDQVTHLGRLMKFWESEVLAEKWMRLTSYDRGIEEREAA